MRELLLATVVRVVDGVTIDVEIGDMAHRVRYLGVEIPGDGGGSIAEEALQFNRFLVEGKTVQLEKGDVDTDSFGSLLRYVYVGGEMVNRALLSNGYATVAAVPPTFRYHTEFLRAQESARTNVRGVWEPPPLPSDRTEPASAPQPAPTEVPAFFGGTLPSPPSADDGARVCDFSGTAQPVIKGNVDKRTEERIYHVPGGLLYSTVVVIDADGDRWFCSEDEASASGFKISKR